MFCPTCGKPLADQATLCSFCGAGVANQTPQNKAVCARCGAALEDYYAVCPNCGQPRGTFQPNVGGYAAPMRTQKSKTGKVIGLISGAVVLVTAVVLILVFTLGGGMKSQLIGTWKSDWGVVYTFKENGELVLSDDNNYYSETYSYRLQGNTLIVERPYSPSYTSERDYKVSFEYSSKAKDESVYDHDYWYIEGDTLYIAGNVMYKQNTQYGNANQNQYDDWDFSDEDMF